MTAEERQAMWWQPVPSGRVLVTVGVATDGDTFTRRDEAGRPARGGDYFERTRADIARHDPEKPDEKALYLQQVGIPYLACAQAWEAVGARMAVIDSLAAFAREIEDAAVVIHLSHGGRLYAQFGDDYADADELKAALAPTGISVISLVCCYSRNFAVGIANETGIKVQGFDDFAPEIPVFAGFWSLVAAQFGREGYYMTAVETVARAVLGQIQEEEQKEGDIENSVKSS